MFLRVEILLERCSSKSSSDLPSVDYKFNDRSSVQSLFLKFFEAIFFQFLVFGKFIERNTPVAFIIVKTAWDAASESSCLLSSRRHLGSLTTTIRTLCASYVIV